MKKITFYSNIGLSLTLLCMLSACSYSHELQTVQGARVVNPNSMNVPAFKEKGDVIVSGKFHFSEPERFQVERNLPIPTEQPISGVDLQSSWAVTEKFGLMLNYAGSSMYENASKFAEFGLGYWIKPKLTPLGDLQITSNIFAGYGYGSRYGQIDLRTDKITNSWRVAPFYPVIGMNSQPISSEKIGSFQSNFHRFFVQPSLIWSYKKSLDWGVSARLSQYYFPNFKQSINNRSAKRALSFGTIEPAFFLSFGPENIKLTTQVQFATLTGNNKAYRDAANMQRGNFAPRNLNFSFGVTGYFGRKK